MVNTNNQETLGFQSEVKQLLQLMIHSLYSNKEIFLRELVSNANDAIDKAHYLSIKDSSLITPEQYRIRIKADKESSTLTISDNGVGMTKEQAKEHLGTIAKSGTKEFLKNLETSELQDSNLIGQFGVGFYSSFIVAHKVDVYSLSITPNSQAIKWSSKGEGEYTLEDSDKNTIGTEIVLHLKDDDKEFLDEWRLKEIITKYSDHISTDIELLTLIKDDKGEETGSKWEKINQTKALWTLDKSKITDEEYKEFYKNLTHDHQEPAAWAHNKVEGNLAYTSLLYLPSKAPWDLQNRDQINGLKLYTQKVFIMDNSEAFLPKYLRFIKGLIDANNLPLNVSREILQDSKITAALKKAITKRALDLLSKLNKNDPEKYQSFWSEFGNVLKEGIAEDYANQAKVAALLRFSSTKNNSNIQNISLAQYIERMKEGQKDIYYLTADSYNAAKNSPHLELFAKKDIEVLLLSEPIDEWMLSYLPEFEGKKLLSITKSDLDLGELKDSQDSISEEKSKEYANILEKIQEILKDNVKEVKITNKLSSSPAIVSTSGDQMTTQMAKLFQATGQEVPAIQYTFEINPENELVQKIFSLKENENFSNWVKVLFDQAILAEKGSLDNPTEFIKNLNSLLLI
ncbi:MAG: molecular chaperone HtpG [Psittacicella sp.]